MNSSYLLIAPMLLTLGAGVAANTPKADFFVALNGSDSWSGKLAAPNAAKTDGPFASVAKAQAAVRALTATGPKRGVTVMVRGGTYHLPLSPTSPGTLKFSAADSGSPAMPITWTNYPGETPVISGGTPVGKGGLGLTWKKAGGNLWQVQLPADTLPFENVFYNGDRRLRSRLLSPNGTGYYMRDGACYSTVAKQAVDISQCSLGTYLRISDTVSPDHPDGAGCPAAVNPLNKTRQKCLDRFYYKPEDPIGVWANLKPVDSPWHKCSLPPSSGSPQGDVEITIFNSWTVDVMRVSCVDTAKHIIYFTGKAFMPGGGGDTYHACGPWPRRRYVVENTKDAFSAAQTAGPAGLWYLDRSASPWTLNYLAKSGEDPNAANFVIAQVPPVSRLGGSLVSAVDLRHVTFRGITFEVDNYVPPPSGFNDDQNTEYTLPTAVDCESCQRVTFDRITVRHTSTTGILIASSSNNSGEPAKDDVIQNSVFYDMGDCGIRIGKGASRFDKYENVPHQIIVQDNIVQGFSRVYPDGEGIALSSGRDIQFLHNDIGDGYHTGIAVCFFGCVGGKHDANGSNILSAYNHIWDSMQGITSDGGTLYYNIGDAGGSGTGNKVLNNLVHDTTSAEIIDGFPDGYGGRGIYLDNMSAGVTVENNVVYNMSQDVAWMSRGPAPGQPGNTFNNNIFAYGRRSLAHGGDWPVGCKEPSLRASFTNNIFYFDRDASMGFDVVQGCAYSCGIEYSKFMNFQGNLYWRKDGKFSQDPKGFHVLKDAPEDVKRCGRDWTYLTFAQWQSGQKPVAWGPPGGMNMDKGGTVTVDPKFGNTGKPTDFLLSKSPLAGFDHTKTNDTIRNAGRRKPWMTPPAVPHTLPTYSYTRADY